MTENNSNIINKSLIRRRFGHSVAHYDHAALPQRQIADQLIEHFDEDVIPPPEGPLLEIGCGTGLLSRLLLQRFDDGHRPFIFNDLSPEVEPLLREKVGSRHTFLPGDAEQMEWPRPLALIASSSCIQWWDAPLSFIARSSLSLQSGGILLYSTFLPDNLSELRPVSGKGLNYPAPSEHKVALEAVGFRDIRIRETRITLTFDGIASLLRHLKFTGTNGIDQGRHTSFWTPDRLRRMEEDYRSINHLSTDDRLPLTYSALLVIAMKR